MKKNQNKLPFREWLKLANTKYVAPKYRAMLLDHNSIEPQDEYTMYDPKRQCLYDTRTGDEIVRVIPEPTMELTFYIKDYPTGALPKSVGVK